MNHRPHRIRLLLNSDTEFSRGVLRGIMSFVHHQPLAVKWQLHTTAPNLENVRALRPWNPAGVIAYCHDQQIESGLHALNVPVINVAGTLRSSIFPRVGIDNRAVGRMAAEHFLQRAIRHFAYVGFNSAYSQDREEGYRGALRQVGQDCIVINRFRDNDLQSDRTVMAALLALPKPAGIFACRDAIGLHLLDLCRSAGLCVPDHVAILSVDNDELRCNTANPALSSIVLPTARLGFEAAIVLDRLLGGKRLPQTDLILPPNTVAARHSSDILAINDPAFAFAVRVIRNQVNKPIKVPDVCRCVGVNRRLLERRFRETFHCSPLDEIHRVRIEHAKELLAHNALSLADVARNCGFNSARQLRTVFRKLTGLPAGAYRKHFRGPRVPSRRSKPVVRDYLAVVP